ncbi:T9SS type A sorting domain-containing protein [uncultured Draconibacterium sp.]|uniref:T9SS type A sorting domain-containing protein n=1 Tax=uncultured Draconibacterium sp. TaxID=1573823 RepID=UPI003217645B
MRNFTPLMLLFIFSLLMYSSKAQITITASDFKDGLVLGSKVTTYLDTTTLLLNVGNPGENTWDFSQLKTDYTFETESKDVASSAYASSFPGAQYASFYSGVFEGIQSSTWVYNSVGDDFISHGTGTVAQAPTGNIETVISFDPAWVQYKLPLLYGGSQSHTRTQTIDITTTVPIVGNITQTISQQVTVEKEVDAYGKVIFPDGKQLNALRIMEVTTFVTDGITTRSKVILFLTKTGELVSVSPKDTTSLNGSIEIENVSWTSGRGETVTATAPTSPSGLQSVINASQVMLSWTDNSDNEDGFYIERRVVDSIKSTSVDDFIRIDSTASNISSYTDLTVVAGYSYEYRILAYNGEGESEASAVIAVNIPLELSGAPQNLMVGIVDATLQLSWSDNAEHEDGFYIERAEDGGGFSVLDSVGAETETYTDINVVEGVEYSYRIQAYLSGNKSEYSNTAVARIVPTAVVDMGSGKVALMVHQNYPNPFKTKTAVNIQLAKPDDVVVVLFDSTGKLVKEVQRSFLEEGTHQVLIDGTLLNGGSYFLKVSSSEYSESIRMLLVK